MVNIVFQWTMVVSGQQAEITGVLKVQVHYYEEGNVQVSSSSNWLILASYWSIHQYI